ncbi:hypothetical protein FRB95_004347 [Tulasnella sp. JGI-2019a]|nr:hypothetical protein FRB95_004347 [Tulasnella sp. JGI-2019a]
MQVNVLVNQEHQVVLSDFGLAVATSEAPSGLSTSPGLIGSVCWCSPELVNGVHQSTACDIWVWGDLLVEVMKECVPYSWIQDENFIIRAITEATLPEPQSRLVSPVNLWSVTSLCWKVGLQEWATRVTVLKGLEMLIGTARGQGIPKMMTSTSGITHTTSPESGVYWMEGLGPSL